MISAQFPFPAPCSFPISLSSSVNIVSYCHKKNNNVATKEFTKSKTWNNKKYSGKEGNASHTHYDTSVNLSSMLSSQPLDTVPGDELHQGEGHLNKLKHPCKHICSTDIHWIKLWTCNTDPMGKKQNRLLYLRLVQ